MSFEHLSTDIPSLSRSEMSVRFQDCDPFGHLNNMRYLDYFLNARDNQVSNDYKLDLFDFIKQTGKGWVVQKHEIAYLRPAQCGENIVLRSATAYFDDYYALVEVRMLDALEQRLKSVLWMHLAFVDTQSGRRIRHDQTISDFFEKVRLKEFSPKEISFDERIKQLNQYYKDKATNAYSV
ncbi:MAG: acyl-CoA thioesterase [Bernardetiaceae bacterium]|nr:acyl-CoA thioesterase [Bernardetiaceae bacterium]